MRPGLVKSARSPAREHLASSIAARDIAEAASTEATSALAAFDDLLTETRTGYYQAEDALAKAKDHLQSQLRLYAGNEREIVKSAAIDGVPSPRAVVAEAEAAFSKAKESYTLGKEGRIQLEMRTIATKHDVDHHERRLMEAIYEVEREPLADLLAAARNIQAQAHAARSVIRHLASNLNGVLYNYNAVTDGLAADVRRFLNSGVGDNGKLAIGPWEAAREALKHDPDAVLPS